MNQKLLLAQLSPMKEVKGFVLFNAEDSIPDDIIFVPVDSSGIGLEKTKVAESLKFHIQNNNGILPVYYFKSLRWIVVGLGTLLHKNNLITIKYSNSWGNPKMNGIYSNACDMKVVYGSLSITTTIFPERLKNPIDQFVILSIEGDTIRINIKEDYYELGYPRFFEVLQ